MRIVAHRGASADAPENTLKAFALARAQGADAIEIDVQPSADNAVVCFHDWDLARLCGRPGSVRRMPLRDVRDLRTGGEPVPTLEEVVLADDRPEGLVVEIKSNAWNDVRIAALTAKVLRRTDAIAKGPVTVSSFNPLCLMTIWRVAPEIPRALLAYTGHALPMRRMWFRAITGAKELHLDHAMLTPRRLRARPLRSRTIVAWTVNDGGEARRLEGLGVDAVITDVPAKLRAALASNGSEGP